MISGYHDPEDLPVKKGDRVRIKKGTIIKRVFQQPREARCSYTVTVDHVLPGSNRHELVRDEKGYHYVATPATNPVVRWAGSGGYWVEADINAVERVES